MVEEDIQDATPISSGAIDLDQLRPLARYCGFEGSFRHQQSQFFHFFVARFGLNGVYRSFSIGDLQSFLKSSYPLFVVNQ